MSELCLSNTPKTRFYSLLTSVFFTFCSVVLSDPLYFSYFIFFSPYLVKVLSFLSPLFITTSLLLLVILTFSASRLEKKLGSNDTEEGNEEDFHSFVELEAYKIVFDTSSTTVEVPELKSREDCLQGFEAPVKCSTQDQVDSTTSTCHENLTGRCLEENSVEIAKLETTHQQEQEQEPVVEEKRFIEGFLKELDEFENTICNVVEVKKVDPHPAKSNNVVGEDKKEESLAVRIGSEATGNFKVCAENTLVKVDSDKGREYPSMVKTEHAQRLGACVNGTIDNEGEYGSKVKSSPSLMEYNNLGSYGSMRKEKEWKRTLACKLFEERHNADGSGEGMDLLWETYEMDSGKAGKKKSNNSTKKKNKKKGETLEYYQDHIDDEDEEEEEEEEEMNAQLCCLQALKFSAGKMNLGMGRPNLVKISKAIKGFGWLHHVTRHGKKGYHGERF